MLSSLTSSNGQGLVQLEKRMKEREREREKHKVLSLRSQKGLVRSVGW